MPRARAVVAVLGFGLVLFAGPIAAAQDEPATERPGDLVVLSGDVTIHRGEEAGEIVVLHGRVTVAGVVRGDVVVLDGGIEVTGQVSGSVVAVNGPVVIGPNAQILGDVILRDRLRVAEGATIGGEIREGTAFTFRTPIDLFGPFAAWLAVAVSTLVLGLFLMLVVPRGSEAVVVAARYAPVRSASIGVAMLIGLPVLGVAAVVSLVGLPFGLALLFGLLLLFSIGVAMSAFAIGRAIWRAPRTRWLAFPIGWFIVAGLLAIPVASGVLWFVGAVYGVGAMTVATWRARGRARPAREGAGRHRAGGKMQPAEEVVEVGEATETLVTERAMREEGTGI
jgi:cytoskeletal protein CcmA (bactofilin family)